MNNFTSARCNSEEHGSLEVIDKESGEIRYISSGSETLDTRGSVRGKSPSSRVKFTPKIYTQLSGAGAHAMAMAKLTSRQYQVLLLIIRDSNRSGSAMTHPSYLAEELEMDVSDVRKALKVLDEKSFIYKSVMKNNGHSYNLNPIYFYHGDRLRIEEESEKWLRGRDSERRKIAKQKAATKRL